MPSLVKKINPSTQCFDETYGQAAHTAKRLAGRRILVVGAGQRLIDDPSPPIGNGRAVSVLFAREGATLTCVDVSPGALDLTCAEVRTCGGSVFAELADVGAR